MSPTAKYLGQLAGQWERAGQMGATDPLAGGLCAPNATRVR